MFIMKRFIVFLCFFLAVSDSKQYCKESKCGNQAIRFPFSLMDDQHQLDDHCRYPGFELSCRNHKTLILKLPVSIEAQVEKIDFQFQEIHLSDPAGCLPSLLQNLNLSSTPFTRGRDQFSSYYTYTLFNCSSINHGLSNPIIKCLSTPRYTVQASRSDQRLDQNMESCRRLYELENIPYGVIEDDEKIFRLRWEKPDCGLCEAAGQRCRLLTMGKTECYNVHKNHRGRTTLIILGVFFGVVALAILIFGTHHRLRNRLQSETFK